MRGMRLRNVHVIGDGNQFNHIFIYFFIFHRFSIVFVCPFVHAQKTIENSRESSCVYPIMTLSLDDSGPVVGFPRQSTNVPSRLQEPPIAVLHQQQQ